MECKIVKIETVCYKVQGVTLDWDVFYFSQYEKKFQHMRKQQFNCFSCEKPFQNGDSVSLLKINKLPAAESYKFGCRRCALMFKEKLERSHNHQVPSPTEPIALQYTD